VSETWRGSISTQRSLTVSVRSKIGVGRMNSGTWRSRELGGCGSWGFGGAGQCLSKSLGKSLARSGPAKPHSVGTTDCSAAGIGCFEPRVDRLCYFRIGHPFRQIFPQCVRMLVRPVCLHWPFLPRTLLVVPIEAAESVPLVSDIPKSKSSLISDNRNCYNFFNSEKMSPCWTSR
jgi:hypothetical protein